ncbi:tetratricopeptide repeat protein [Terrisporobacter petrolearius]|uniref:tetratricopeptide repeat protein n=1 Tax=Terrisporobacter petrolearius TaxID=1460447 RepID=UPI0031CC9C01
MIKACEDKNSTIDKATYYLKINDYDLAIYKIKEAMVEDLSSGRIHNLLGIYYEKRGDYNKAIKHYRVANDLEPTLIAPRKNLERIVYFKYLCNDKYIDYGE